MEKVLISWSGGKDACLALEETRRGAAGSCEVVGLLTTVAREDGKIPIHGVSRELIEAQAHALRLPLIVVEIPKGATNAEYESALRCELSAQRESGVGGVVFGDLFLADVRDYRERLLAPTGVRGLFPLWLRDTARLAAEFVELNYTAIVVAVDSRALERTFAGRDFDRNFINALPPSVDPCGERGEFHTFVSDGGPFTRAVNFKRGEVSEDAGHFVCELMPQ
ncbi:MAG: hypothetical protein QOE33_2935 [Acidobacteriota bacterium]|nr:hypothetical protein [Acidobacteriota bacterium]